MEQVYRRRGHVECAGGIPFWFRVELIWVRWQRKRAKARERPSFLDRSPQPGRLEGNGEFLGDLDQYLEAVGGVGFCLRQN